MSEISGAPHAAPEARKRTDLSLELLRQHTLLQLLTARMNETAEALDQAIPIPLQHVQRGLAVHRDYLIDSHHRLEALVADALASSTGAEVRTLLAECATSHPLAEKFQKEVRALVDLEPSLSPSTRTRAAALFRAEAKRIETHHGREDEVYAGLNRYLPEDVRTRILTGARAFDPDRIAAEIELVAWASSVHPSSG
ncbi:MAG: hypothetical protein L3K03_03180 [Thermoplasmata archaeon]|nr:hypothetical protein [Thermoplasmata archaeon]